jgi:acetoin utilization deacetylase AcuC-like enzyme
LLSINTAAEAPSESSQASEVSESEVDDDDDTSSNTAFGFGPASLLADDPKVFTYSIHVGPNYPTEKIRSSMDVETVRYVEGGMYLKQLFSSLAAALDVFSPDLVIWIAGADNHSNDRFGQMYLSLRDLQKRDEVLLGAFLRNRVPVAALYGGGYNRQTEFTAKIHRNTVATAKKLAEKWHHA